MTPPRHILQALTLAAALAAPLAASAALAEAPQPPLPREAVPAQATPDPREALARMAERAEAGDAEAQYRLSLLHERGFDSIPADSVRARSLLERSARGGYLPAQNLLGFTLIREGEPDLGLQWIERAGMAGDPKAQSNIGYLLVAGEGVERDPEKGAWWLAQAAANGVPQAASMLGDLYAEGIGVGQDTAKADSLYRTAFLAGIPDAAVKSESLRTSPGTPAERLDRAILYYTHGAPALGVRLLNTLVGPSEATEPHIRGAASALLGDAYTRAQGVPYSHELSTRHYLEAARLGNPAAEFIIAELLEIFPDAVDDPSLSADELRRRAAAQGVLTAEDASRRLLNPGT
ncbi:MAG: sel1 repeat family protein [Bacteroides sp.]|nr:sel1 repeat family protein [Bacteroides sp.]